MTTTTKLKRAVVMRAGGTPTVADPSMWDENGLPWVSIADMSKAPTVVQTDRRVSLVGLKAKSLPVGPPGTLLFAMYASVGAVGVLGIEASWNQAILGMAARPDLADPRFVRYWLEHLKPELAAITRTNTQDNLNAEQVGNAPFPVLPVPTQRAVADYLDCETTGLDSLIEARRAMVAVLEERSAGEFEAALGRRGFVFPRVLEPDWSDISVPDGWRVMRLSQTLVRLTNGYVGPTRDILRDSGIRYVQSLHIKGGRIDFGRRPFFVDEEWHRERPRIHLRPNDVLIVQTGDIGQVAVVPKGFGEASCHALQIARVNPKIVTGPYLGTYLRSPFGYHSLLSRATGALHPHLEAGIRDVPVVVPPRETQADVLSEIEQAQRPIDAAVSAVERQTSLLRERRQALITATVTGECEIAGAPA